MHKDLNFAMVYGTECTYMYVDCMYAFIYSICIKVTYVTVHTHVCMLGYMCVDGDLCVCRMEHMNKVVYSNPVSPEYFQQFNTSSR